MELFVTCDCNRKTTVTSAKCGEDISCICGNVIRVPTLRKLKSHCQNSLASSQSPSKKKAWDVGASLRLLSATLGVGSLSAAIAYLAGSKIASSVLWWSLQTTLHAIFIVCMIHFYDRKKASAESTTFPVSTLSQSILVGTIFILLMSLVDVLMSPIVDAILTSPGRVTATRMYGEVIAIRVLKLFPTWVVLLFAMRCVLRKIGLEELRSRSLRITIAFSVFIAIIQVVLITIMVRNS
jgi:uncharacterized membrane protein